MSNKTELLRKSGKTTMINYFEMCKTAALNGEHFPLPPPLGTVRPELFQELINHLKELEK